MRNWVEFVANGDRIVVRPEHIIYFETQSMGYTKLWVDVGRSPQEVVVSEPYERVKQKIMAAEKVDYSNVVAEHFTKEEYEKLLSAVQIQVDNCTVGHLSAQVNEWRKLENKINEILKEGE